MRKTLIIIVTALILFLFGAIGWGGYEMGKDYGEQNAEEIRAATHALDSLIGRIGIENVLDEVFSSFCLGK